MDWNSSDYLNEIVEIDTHIEILNAQIQELKERKKRLNEDMTEAVRQLSKEGKL